jgi:glutamate/tyrosine decarboxylase-like PLP-dependent enzyme
MSAAGPLRPVPAPAPAQQAPAELGVAIPKTGVDKEALLDHMQQLRGEDADWRNARTWSLVYFADDEHYDTLKQAHGLFFSENALNPMAFTSLKQMEAEVVRMTARMLNGPEDAVGTMTSGGTESLLMAVKAYRDRAKKKWPWIRRPNMVLPRSAHPAFEKAAHYFGVRCKFARVGKDYRVDTAHVRKLVDRNTILLVGSAPQYAHGVVDPIEELGEIAQKHKLPLHVDGCIGGFVLPWVEKLGHAVPRWDFRVPGVTSVSADLHKYGYAAKGASTLIYRSMDYLKHQFFVCTDFPGGIYASPSMPGTRPGGTIAAAWAALHHMGEDRYLEHTKAALEAARRLREGITDIPGVRILGTPHATLLAWGADDESGDDAIDVYAVADALSERGWLVDRQQHPASVHLTVTSNHLGVVDQYLADLRASVEHVRAHPELKTSGEAPMYGMMAKLPVRGLVKLSVQKVMEQMYGPGGGAPDLAELGSSDDDDPLFQLLGKHMDKALAALDKVEDARALGRKLLGRDR